MTTPSSPVIAKHDFLDDGLKVFSAGVGRITVLPMILPGEDVEELARVTRQRMLEQLRLLS